MNFLGRALCKLWAIENQDALETARAERDFWRAKAEWLEVDRDQWKYNAERLMSAVVASGFGEQVMAHATHPRLRN